MATTPDGSAEFEARKAEREKEPAENIRTWKVETTAAGVSLALNGRRFTTASGHAIAFALNRAASGLNAPADAAEHRVRPTLDLAAAKDQVAALTEHSYIREALRNATQAESTGDLVSYLEEVAHYARTLANECDRIARGVIP